MGIETSTWRQRIGAFVCSPRLRPTRAKVNFCSPPNLHCSRKSKILMCFPLLLLGLMFVFINLLPQTPVILPPPAEMDSAFNRPSGTEKSLSFYNRPHYQLSAIQYLHASSLLLITRSMDIHPNPGPSATHILREFTDPEQRMLFNKAKRLTRYEHHRSNYIYYHKNKIIPKGLVIKCRPSLDSSSSAPACEQLNRQWTQLLTRTSREMIKLLKIECNKHLTLSKTIQ